MIVVRADDGSEIVTLGPSYGKGSHQPHAQSHAGRDDLGRRPPVCDHWGGRSDRDRPVGLGAHAKGHCARAVRPSPSNWRATFLNSNRTFDRKIREIVLAMALETKFSKDQILELYLNKVYFGGGAYGVDLPASRKFFGHSGEQLSLAEASIIAGLVKAPSHYSPTADAKAAVERAQIVLKTMEEAGAITRPRNRPPIPEPSSWPRKSARIRRAISPTGSCRNWTSCCPTTIADRGMDHARPRRATRRDRGDPGQCAKGCAKARWSAFDRDGAVLAGRSAAPITCIELQPRDHPAAPAGFAELFVYLVRAGGRVQTR